MKIKKYSSGHTKKDSKALPNLIYLTSWTLREIGQNVGLVSSHCISRREGIGSGMYSLTCISHLADKILAKTRNWQIGISDKVHMLAWVLFPKLLNFVSHMACRICTCSSWKIIYCYTTESLSHSLCMVSFVVHFWWYMYRGPSSETWNNLSKCVANNMHKLTDQVAN